MRHTPPPSANQAASALLHLGMTLATVLGALSLAGHFGPQLHAGKALLYATALVGAVLILRSMLRLFRDATAPRPTAVVARTNGQRRQGAARG